MSKLWLFFRKSWYIFSHSKFKNVSLLEFYKKYLPWIKYSWLPNIYSFFGNMNLSICEAILKNKITSSTISYLLFQYLKHFEVLNDLKTRFLRKWTKRLLCNDIFASLSWWISLFYIISERVEGGGGGECSGGTGSRGRSPLASKRHTEGGRRS